jgi:glycosyltransferase involved in cell wall biosynthesis
MRAQKIKGENQNHGGSDRDRAPAVSVIIPAYNVAAFIKETLDSVFAQTFTDYEVIVINDGSPDTVELELALEPYSRQICYLKQNNQGAGAARNAGLRAAGGRFVAFLDGDDVYLPTFLGEQMEFIQSDGGYDLVYADASRFGDQQLAAAMETNASAGEVTAESLLCGRCNVITSTVLARRELIFETGLFDETLRNSQDFDLWIRLAKNGARINYQCKILLLRRIYAWSLAADPAKSFEGELRVLEKTRLRNDLTAAEVSALEHTLMRRLADMELVRGKRSLLEGDYKAAMSSFQRANDYFHSLKLRIVLVSLRIAPGLLQRVYKLRHI